MMDGYWRQIMERRDQEQRTLENQLLVNGRGGSEVPDATQLAQSPARKDKEGMIWKAVESASRAV
jgi:hypothetical protein